MRDRIRDKVPPMLEFDADASRGVERDERSGGDDVPDVLADVSTVTSDGVRRPLRENERIRCRGRCIGDGFECGDVDNISFGLGCSRISIGLSGWI